MKRLLVLGGLLMALNGYSQSYLILNNGVTLTTDTAAFVYDFGHFIPPYKVTLSGGQFLAEEEKLITIDSKGFVYRKDEKVPKKLRGKGANYLISDNGVILTIDANGFYYKFDKDAAMKKTVLFGGNFFTVKMDDKKPTEIYTVNEKGNYFKLNVAGLNPADIATVGGNFFMTKTGVVYTVSKEGFVFAKPETKTGIIKKAGGNFFIDANNMIYTVSKEGFLMLPSLPANLKIESITKLGSNYFIDADAKLFVIDSTGAIIEREIKDHDIRNVKLLSL